MKHAVLCFTFLYITLLVANAQPAWQANLDSKIRFYQTTDFGIVLAGTELPLLLREVAIGVPLLDTTIIHVRAAVDRIMA